MVHQVVKEINSLHLLVVVNVGLVEPCKVLAFKLWGEDLVLVNWSTLDLVHLVKLALEEDEFLSLLRLSVHHTLLILLKCINNLQEVALAHEELKVLCITPLCKIENELLASQFTIHVHLYILTSDSLDGNKKSVLIKVLFQRLSLIVLQPKIETNRYFKLSSGQIRIWLTRQCLLTVWQLCWCQQEPHSWLECSSVFWKAYRACLIACLLASLHLFNYN